jgi:outer membrane protein OmpA-like peptidoglycan-associated protein
MASPTTFEATLGTHRVAFSAGAAGTAVVLSSTVWVLGTIVALPSFTQSPEGTRVAATTLVTVPFEGASTNVSAEQRAALDAVADRLKEAAASNEIVLESHATGGSQEANLAIAEQRAQAIREYLARQHGIPREKIQVVSQGEERPQADIYRNTVAVVTTRRGGT